MTAIARILTVLIGIPATGLAFAGTQALAHAANTMPDSHWPWLRLALSAAITGTGAIYIACQLADKETHR
jgi:hypothetical protein